MKYANIKEIKVIKTKYDKEIDSYYNKEQKYLNILKKLGCTDCQIYQNDKQLNFVERHNKCKKCKHGEKVTAVHSQLVSTNHKIDKVFNEYAKVVFEVLSEKKPKIIHRRSENVYNWNDIFPNTFKEVNDSLKKSLVALIEEKGGSYRIKKTLFWK